MFSHKYTKVMVHSVSASSKLNMTFLICSCTSPCQLRFQSSFRYWIERDPSSVKASSDWQNQCDSSKNIAANRHPSKFQRLGNASGKYASSQNYICTLSLHRCFWGSVWIWWTAIWVPIIWLANQAATFVSPVRIWGCSSTFGTDEGPRPKP